MQFQCSSFYLELIREAEWIYLNFNVVFSTKFPFSVFILPLELTSSYNIRMQILYKKNAPT